MEDLKICQKSTKYEQVMFCEAVKADMANSKDTSFNNITSSTLSLTTVLIEDLFEAITIHKELCGEKVDPKPSISLLNKTNTFDGYNFSIGIINNDEYNALQKELLLLFEGYCIFGFGEFYKKQLCILVEVNKTMYGNNEDVPKKHMEIFLLGSPGIINHMIPQREFTHPVFPQTYCTILNKQEFIIHNSVTQSVQFSLSTMPTMSTIYDKPRAGWNGIKTDDYFKIISKRVKLVMRYKKKKIYNSTTV
jgi:hypothetical protein